MAAFPTAGNDNVDGDKIADIEFSVVVLDNATHPLTDTDFVL